MITIELVACDDLLKIFHYCECIMHQMVQGLFSPKYALDIRDMVLDNILVLYSVKVIDFLIIFAEIIYNNGLWG